MFAGGDILTIAVGLALAGAIAFLFWLAGDDDWRDALEDIYGDVVNVPHEMTGGENVAGGDDGKTTARLTHKHGSHSHDGEGL